MKYPQEVKSDKFYYNQNFSNILIAVNGIILLLISLFLFLGIMKLAYFLGISILVLDLIVIHKSVQMLYRRVFASRNDYHQLESLMSIHNVLDLKMPMPHTRSYAASPDFLNFLIYQLHLKKPKVIVEASSGISSMIISEWIAKHSPETKHFALDHEEKYANLSRSRISNPNSKIIHAPLQSYEIGNESFRWYNIDGLKDVDGIDMLIVDGPPWHINDLARYPAFPLLKEKLNHECSIILDDGWREFEQKIVKEWEKSGQLTSEYFNHLEKGAFLLQYSSR